MFTEDDLLPLSSLQHLAFCERQWALIHLEQAWAENRLTAEGALLHERAHEERVETRPGLRTVRGLRLHSFHLGLSGQADVVEFTRPEGTPYPVEYKHGKPKPEDWDRVQLCAQALCLEEMMGCAVPGGALFYGRLRRRVEVEFDQPLRDRTRRLAARLHELWEARKTPAPFAPRSPEAKRCRSCSLVELCMPKVTARGKDVSRYVRQAMAAMTEEGTCE